MSGKDYSATPLTRKLGAGPRAAVTLLFTTGREDLGRRFPELARTLGPADTIWVAWPKKASPVESDLSFASVQEIGLAAGLVDNKSCSIDADWQALRFVYRLADRPPR